jgi:mannobiose 2-epimerase
MNAAGYREEVSRELQSILRYWMDYTPDQLHGGFIGRVDENDRPDPQAPKGLVLNARILWTFSAAYHHTGSSVYLSEARRAYEYLLARFLDSEYGGAYWSLDASGRPLNDRKQIYGQAFCLYGLSEFYRAAGEPAALHEAITLFRLIEQYSFDGQRKGYYEAFTRQWQQPEDRRLSEKDANEQKTMNTHLHVLEAYTNLYRAWPDDLLRQRIRDLLEVFDRYIVDPESGHLTLFFSEEWEPRSTIVSYGHDIEAAWLLQEAAESIGDEEWIDRVRSLALAIATAAAEGLDADGGLWYEKEQAWLIREKHWWPQAEAMVGFLHAWQVSGEEIWWQRSLGSWKFVRQYIRDPAGKEWYWGVLADHSPMPGQDKAGFWKCPYHNSRACLEIMRRLSPPPSQV